MRRLRTFHRYHGALMSIVVFMAAGSGLLHTVMALTQSPPPAPRPGAAVDLSAATVPPSALSELVGGGVVSASLRNVSGRPWWQVISTAATAPIYIDAATGQRDDHADERYAAEIATSFLGGATVAHTAYLTRFDDEYIVIFRMLPVHRFTTNDGLGTRVYVSTLTGSVTRHTDDARQREATVFSLLHKWQFIRHRGLRDGVIIAAMLGLMVLALSGLVLLWRTRRPGSGSAEQS